MDNTSFLPEDYVAQKAEHRTNIICLSLFAVVMASVFAVFLLTNKQASAVKVRQAAINQRYEEAALQIQELTTLEEQKDEMLERAEIASALVERVPRSILLAELINRMPDRLGLISLDLTSDKITKVPNAKPTAGRTGRPSQPKRAMTKEEANEMVGKIEVPRHLVTVTMVGVAPSDMAVAHYMAELNSYDLIDDVELKYSEESELEGRMLREFCIDMKLDIEADVRHVEPLKMPRDLRNPMSDQLQFGTGEQQAPAVVPVPNTEEH